ncbi:MAG TPA: type 2 isopentenyl-diphosphate Delta-isomerase [Candidatus Limnocylindria bacterium]|nr:type 2 isopentenyl-diphosphate Delta-isomerase [Candidatus Limnocylindria bacterium]
MASSTRPSGDRAAIERRKAEHLRIAAEEDVETRRAPGWDDVHLVHDALPVTDADRIDLSARLLGHVLALPLVIAGMTGGHSGAERVNATLADAAARHGLGMGVGSQRAALRDPSLRRTYAVVRERAPKAFVIANVGVSQLVAQDDGAPLGAKDIRALIEMVGANAIALHLNYLEESVQPEGQTRASGVEAAIRRLVRQSSVPVIAKETGAGVSGAVATRLKALGIRAVDVGGVGGTSFAAIEALRAEDRGDLERARLGQVFRDWGLPSAVAVAGSVRSGLPVIATGGVRGGLDAAKALALGATAVGVGRPLLQAALDGADAVDRWIAQFTLELRTATFLSGVARSADLGIRRPVVTGSTRAWIDQLGYGPRPRTAKP